MRLGEILGLKWEDINFEMRRLVVRRAIQRAKLPEAATSRLIVVTPKTTKSVRTITLPNVAVSALVAHKMRQDEERAWAGSDWQETGYVFTTPIGTPLDQKMVDKATRSILAAAELPKIRFHDLRHSAVALLIALGVHPRVIMELLGHSSITTTMNTYGHLFEEFGRQTADTMDEIFGSEHEHQEQSPVRRATRKN
jgi:integrase